MNLRDYLWVANLLYHISVFAYVLCLFSNLKTSLLFVGLYVFIKGFSLGKIEISGKEEIRFEKRWTLRDMTNDINSEIIFGLCS